MQMTTDIVTIALSILGSVIIVAISWGSNQASHNALKEKVSDMRAEVEKIKADHERDLDKFVTLDMFKSVIEPIHQQLASIQCDIKDMIRLLSKSQTRREQY